MTNKKRPSKPGKKGAKAKFWNEVFNHRVRPATPGGALNEGARQRVAIAARQRALARSAEEQAVAAARAAVDAIEAQIMGPG